MKKLIWGLLLSLSLCTDGQARPLFYPDFDLIWQSFENTQKRIFALSVLKENYELELEKDGHIFHERLAKDSSIQLSLLQDFSSYGIQVDTFFEREESKILPPSAPFHKTLTRWQLPWLKIFKKFPETNQFVSLQLMIGPKKEKANVVISTQKSAALAWGYFYAHQAFTLGGALTLVQSAKNQSLYGEGHQITGTQASFWKNFFIKKNIGKSFWGVIDVVIPLYTGITFQNPYFQAKTDRGYGLKLGIGLEKRWARELIGLTIFTSSVVYNVYESSYGTDYDYEEEHSGISLQWQHSF